MSIDIEKYFEVVGWFKEHWTQMTESLPLLQGGKPIELIFDKNTLAWFKKQIDWGNSEEVGDLLKEIEMLPEEDRVKIATSIYFVFNLLRGDEQATSLQLLIIALLGFENLAYLVMGEFMTFDNYPMDLYLAIQEIAKGREWDEIVEEFDKLREG